MAPTAANPSNLILVRLYRNLLRAAKPYTAPAPNARVLNCLLHRTGIDDHISDWEAFVSSVPKPDSHVENQARDLSVSYKMEGGTSGGNDDDDNVIPPNRTYQRLFRRLLREVVCAGNYEGIRKSMVPSVVDPTILRHVIRREFRDGPSCQSIYFDTLTRRQVAFTALRELNKKLSYYDHLNSITPDPLPQQAARNVTQLPQHPPSSYLRPGAFLVAHPHMQDSYFEKSVICILEHVDPDLTIADEDKESVTKRQPMPGQTYGIIINRVSVHLDTGKNRTLKEAFEKHLLPGMLADVFGDSVVREGGPVHVSLQMLHSLSGSEGAGENEIGGRLIPAIPEDEESSAALFSDRATYFQGELFKAMVAVDDGKMDRATWAVGQLQSEIAQGFWIPCRGPPEMALTGICEHEPSPSGNNRPLADLWLSMLSACGEEEAKLAHLFYHEDWDETGLPCDAFENDIRFS